MSTYITQVKIAGTLYGTGGFASLVGLEIKPSGRPGVLAGLVHLEFGPAASYSFHPKQEVQVYAVDNVTGDLAARYVGGFITRRASGQVPGGANRPVSLSFVNYGTELDSLISTASGIVTIAAGALPAQLSAIMVNFNGGAPRTFGTSVYGSPPFTTTVLPAISYSGRSLRYVIELLCQNLEAAIPAARCRYHVGLATTTGAVAFGEPILYMYDSALAPAAGAPYWDFRDTGAPLPLYDPFAYAEDGVVLANRGQSVMFDGQVATVIDAGSVAAYPNPFDPAGAWQAPLLHDSSSRSLAEATALLTGRIRESKDPALSVGFRTNERVLPYDWVKVTWLPDSLSAAVYQASAMVIDFTVPFEPWVAVVAERDGGLVGVSAAAGGPPAAPSVLVVGGFASPDGREMVAKITIGTTPGAVAYEVISRVDIFRDGSSYTSWVTAGSRPGSGGGEVSGLLLDELYEFQARGIDAAGIAGPWSATVTELEETPVQTTLPNAGFEIPRRVNKTDAEAWLLTRGAGSGTAERIDTDAYEGNCCLALRGTALLTPEVTSRRVGVNPSEPYLLRFYAKSSSAVPANFYVNVAWWDKSGALVSAADEVNGVTVPTSWTEIARKLAAPAGAASVSFAPRLGTGTAYSVYLDSFSFSRRVVATERSDAGRETLGMGPVVAGLVASGLAMGGAVPSGVPAAVAAWQVSYFVGAPNNAGNHWLITLEKLDAAGAFLVMATVSTNGGAAGAWVQAAEVTAFANALVAGDQAVVVRATIVGAPGALSVASHVDALRAAP